MPNGQCEPPSSGPLATRPIAGVAVLQSSHTVSAGTALAPEALDVQGSAARAADWAVCDFCLKGSAALAAEGPGHPLPAAFAAELAVAVAAPIGPAVSAPDAAEGGANASHNSARVGPVDGTSSSTSSCASAWTAFTLAGALLAGVMPRR